MGKKLIVVLSAAILLVALGVAPAFADPHTMNAVTSYNNSGFNWTYNGPSTDNSHQGNGANAGIYVRNPANGNQYQAFAGPHGGYDTTTNKCQDCHSTHFALGSYMLLRADSRAQACDFCHTGGGGSATNIQMDNTYSASSTNATTTMGFGTGHTLGYAGNAPAGIIPAFSDSQGFACFDCHSPHGNSARILQFPFADPGRPMSTAKTTTTIYKKGANAQGTPVYTGAAVALATYAGAQPDSQTAVYWGWSTDTGNALVWGKNPDTLAIGLMNKPVWQAFRFLLIQDPNSSDVDTDVAVAGTTAQNGTVKYAISWADPIGPADTAYGGDDAARSANPSWNNTTTANMPYASGANTYKGILSVSEFCADCHNGAAGMSNQAANVWVPDKLDSTTGTYTVAYAHDAQPRH